MDAQSFAYWLQGFAELNPEPPTHEQWQSIREHLALVFHKVTPPVQAPIDLGELKWPQQPKTGDFFPVPYRIECISQISGNDDSALTRATC